MKYRKLKKYKYQLMDTVKIKLSANFGQYVSTNWVEVNGETITVQKGYCWDGATCAIDTLDFMIPSVVHDALYQLIRIKKIPVKYRKSADKVLKNLCSLEYEDVLTGKRYKMPSWRIVYVYWAVRIRGAKHLNLGIPQDKIYEIKF